MIERLTGIECESSGSDSVSVRGNRFQYFRQGDTTSLDLDENLTVGDVYFIKEVIQLYEELISLN